jgi:hypothetical protein
MSDVAAVDAVVEKVVQTPDPKVVASELAGQIQPLLQSLDTSELETKHQIGCILNARLKPAGQKRLPYGGKVMEKLAEELNLSRSSLNRMCQFASQYLTPADFEAKHPNVTTWSQVKVLLVKPKAANQRKTDLTRAHLQQCARSLDTYVARFKKSLNGSYANLLGECQHAAQALAEVFQQHLATNSTTPQNSPISEPSTQEGNTQLESVALSTAQ